jgi:CBS domain-containing protein
MSTEVLTARVGMSLEEAIKLLVNNKITGLPVIDEKGQLVGVYSEYDVLTQIAQAERVGPKMFQTEIRFSSATHTISENMPLEEVLKTFVDAKYRRLPVLDAQKRLVGIITRRDLMRLYFFRAKLS